MDKALHELKQLTESISPISPQDWDNFSTIWHPYSAKRKQVLTTTGSTERYLYFVEQGVQRIYYIDQHDREATLLFTYAPSFGGVIDSFLLQHPSRYCYETLTTSVFLRASFNDLQPLMQTNPAIATMIRQGVTHALSGVLERLVELQCYSSTDKFKQLLHRSPHILQLVPHKYLANYLGINATNFSKLINNVMI